MGLESTMKMPLVATCFRDCYDARMIKVLREGVHIDNRFEGYTNFEPICSSTILIQSAGQNIIIDPGHIAMLAELFELLKKEDLAATAINYVFLTHHHLDHASSMGAFPKAKIFMGDGYVVHDRPLYQVYKDLKLLKLPTGLEIFPTPGHTLESNSYRFEENGIRYMCAGDAVREDVIREGALTVKADGALYLASLRKIFKQADVIIPGHGRVIEGELKQELQKMVEEITE